MPVEIILSVIITSILVAFVTYYFANLKSHFKIEEKQKQSKEKPDIVFKDTILKEIEKLSDSYNELEATAQELSGVFSRELDTKVSQISKQLSSKYEGVIHEKDKQVKIIKEKYEDVSGRYKKLNVEKRQTEAVVRSMAEGLIVVDDKGEVLLMNPAAEKLLNVEKKNKIGKPLDKDLKQEQLMSMVSPGKSGKEKEIVLKSNDEDTKKVLRSSSAVIESKDGKTVGMVSVLSDITKQRELEELKSKFVSNVSHELRTPLVAIQKSLSVILSSASGPLTEPQKKFLTIAERNLDRLSRLIEDVLNFSKVESGKLELKKKPSSIKRLIEDSCDSLENWAKSKFIEFEKDVPNNMPEVNIDPDRITQVLINLIGNAVKFTPQNGKIIIKAGKLPESGKLEVNVTDTGVGISKADLPKIFDRFQQSGERESTDISGTGLGLAIAKEIVKLHGGDIWAESEKGKGATFSFTLPL
jgi:PAS domain S-box-containing protein